MNTLSEKIMATDCPWNNPYQGQDKKVLFVCSAGILRSATAARIYAAKYNTRAAGSESYALIPVTNELIVWANEIVFVNRENFDRVHKNHNLTEVMDKVVVLNIPDKYPHMDIELIKAFKEQYIHV